MLLLDHARKRIEMRQHVDQTEAIILTFENILLITYDTAFHPWYSLRNGVVLCICTEMDTFFDSQFTSIPYLWLNGFIISSLTVVNLVYGYYLEEQTFVVDFAQKFILLVSRSFREEEACLRLSDCLLSRLYFSRVLTK